MPIHEIDLDSDFNELSKFAMNILQQQARIAPGSSEEIDINVRYLQTQAQVHLTHKIHVALGNLTDAVNKASTAASADAANSLSEARRMSKATWGLVCGTVLLAIATFALVYYTRELVRVELTREPAAVPVQELGNGPNP